MYERKLVTTNFQYSDTGQIAFVTFDNAARANCLSWDVINEIRYTFDALKKNRSVRVTVLASAENGAFCAGADLKALSGFDTTKARAYICDLHATIRAIRTFPVPIIARIQGACIGAGLELAAGCDLRICADHAKFSMPEVELDIPSVIEAALLPRLIGWGRTSWLLYRGDAIDARTAESWGLIEKAVPAQTLDVAIEECSTKLASNGATGMRLQKKLMQKWENSFLEQAIEAGIDAFAESYSVGDANKRIQEAISKRKP
tara:strand:- start:48 stop:827 length:780 start_codon:yes stop_codon:yes gene_type:complete